MRKLSEDIRKQIIELYSQKLSTVQVGKLLNISSTGVSKILKENNIYIRNISESKKGIKKGSKLPTEDIIHEYVVNFKTSHEIGKQFNCTHRSILLILKDNNIILRKSGWSKNYQHPKTELIKELYNSGKSTIEVSQLTNTSKTLVNKIVNKLNIVRSELKNKPMLGKHHNENTKNRVRNTKEKRKEDGLYDHIYLKKTGLTYKEFIKQQPKFKQYFNKVRNATNKNDLSKLEHFNNRSHQRIDGAYQLDHKYSIIEGFKNNVDPEIIGHICNLEMIPWKQNQQKQGRCSHTIQELMGEINNYNNNTTLN